MRCLILYGSTTGNTEAAALKIASEMRNLGVEALTVDVAFIEDEILEGFDLYIFGVSTWYHGDMQSDWAMWAEQLSNCGFLENANIALFGCGDQFSYPRDFCSALGKIYHQYLTTYNPRVLGKTSTDGYNFLDSEALLDRNTALGLMLDFENQRALNKKRIRSWCEKIMRELHNGEENDK